MIKSLTATNYLGETVKIVLAEGDPDHGMVIQSIDGLGPPKANINTTSLSSMDGSKFNSAKVGERNIVIGMLFTFAPKIEDSRQRTYKYFPIKRPVELIIEADNRIAKTTGYVESNEPDIFSSSESNQISIICDDPYLYSAGVNGTTTTVLNGTEPGFEFIFSNESLTQPLLEFGQIDYKTEKNVYYEGDAEIGIVITMHAIGSAGNITIYNTGTREVMKLDNEKIKAITGSGIKAGDDIIINTTRGNKSVVLLRDGFYTNILNSLDRNSDWFHLAKGDNVFAYETESGFQFLQFKIENNTIYEGV